MLHNIRTKTLSEFFYGSDTCIIRILLLVKYSVLCGQEGLKIRRESDFGASMPLSFSESMLK